MCVSVEGAEEIHIIFYMARAHMIECWDCLVTMLLCMAPFNSSGKFCTGTPPTLALQGSRVQTKESWYVLGLTVFLFLSEMKTVEEK